MADSRDMSGMNFHPRDSSSVPNGYFRKDRTHDVRENPIQNSPPFRPSRFNPKWYHLDETNSMGSEVPKFSFEVTREWKILLHTYAHHHLNNSDGGYVVIPLVRQTQTKPSLCNPSYIASEALS